ncbi:MAG: hypothetical protein IT198_12825 [Acidimicrobiia bacterium]|nr:hypothetical protein [Acidimicrobiia bacterium]
MSELVTAEWRKATLRILPYGMFALAAVYLALTLLLIPIVTSILPPDVEGVEDLTAFLANVKAPGGYVFAAQQAVGQAAIFVTIFVAVAVAAEYGWGTMTATFVLEPRRGRVLAAKLLALCGISLAGTTLLFVVGVVMVAAVQPLLPPEVTSEMHGAWPVPTLRALGLGLPSIVVWVCVACALAVLTRNAGAAAGIGVGMAIGEGLLQLVPLLRPILVSSNTQALQSVTGVDPSAGFFGVAAEIPAWRASLVLVVWAVAAVALAAWCLRRRDVT